MDVNFIACLMFFRNHPKRHDYVHLYVDVVYQTTQIFDIDATFPLGLINAIKKKKCFEMELWTKDQVNQLVASIERYVKPTKTGKS